MDISIYPNFRGVEDLVEIMRKHGATVREFSEADDLQDPRPDYTIIFLNLKELFSNRKYSKAVLPHDGYAMSFISKYDQDPTGADLRKFKITPSNYKIQRHDVNDILAQRVSWNDLVRLRTPRPRVSNFAILRLYNATRYHNYDDSSSSESQEGQDLEQEDQDRQQAPKPNSVVLPISPENKASTSTGVTGTRSSPRKRKRTLDQRQSQDSRAREPARDDSHIDVDLDIDVDESERVVIPPTPESQGRNGSGDNGGINNDNSQNEQPLPGGQVEVEVRRKKKQLDFFSQAFVPPLDKRNRVIRNSNKKKVVAPINTWLGGSGNSSSSSDEEEGNVNPNVNANVNNANANVETEDDEASPGRVPVADPEFHISDSEISLQSAVSPSSSSVSSSVVGRGRRTTSRTGRRRRVSDGAGLSGRRPGTGLRLYTQSDSQHMLDLVLKNEWARYVKGNGLWEYVVKHKLLEHRIGARSAQALLNHFKRKISPQVENMTTGGNFPFIVSSNDLIRYKQGRDVAARWAHQKQNGFPEPRSVRDVKRV